MASADATMTIKLDRDMRRYLDLLIKQQKEIIALLREQMGKPPEDEVGPFLNDYGTHYAPEGNGE